VRVMDADAIVVMFSKAAVTGHGVVRVVGARGIYNHGSRNNVTASHCAHPPQEHFTLFLWVTSNLTDTDGRVDPGPLVIGDVGCVGHDDTRHRARCLPKSRKSG
jgi:hypothetical protein